MSRISLTLFGRFNDYNGKIVEKELVSLVSTSGYFGIPDLRFYMNRFIYSNNSVSRDFKFSITCKYEK